MNEKHKYKEGQEVWLYLDEIMYQVIIKKCYYNTRSRDNYPAYTVCFNDNDTANNWHEDSLFATRDDLIRNQIEYWKAIL